MTSWDDLRYVLAIARHGSLSAAARVLGVTQPTVGRRIRAYEARLGARLFVRGPSGLSVTSIGRTMLAAVERMESDALDAERSAFGRDDGLRGSIRITASEWLAVRVLGPALAPLLERNAGLSVDIAAEGRHLNLGRREADLALRPRTFEHQTVYQRRVGRIELGLYASPAYLARTGATTFAAHGAGHALITMTEELGDVARTWLLTHAKAARIVARTNGREPMATLAVAGVGVACLPRIIGDATPGLRPLTPPVPLPTRPLWLGVHRDMRHVPRVRATIDALAEALPRLTRRA